MLGLLQSFEIIRRCVLACRNDDVVAFGPSSMDVIVKIVRLTSIKKSQ
jgi:hypothetical protein